MGVKPNVLVGAVGFVVFLVTGAFIITHWRELTDTNTYEVSVSTDRQDFLLRDHSLAASGASRVEAYRVSKMNVTQVGFRLTWDDTSGPRNEWTAVLRNAQGEELASGTNRNGLVGVTIDHTVRSAPETGQRFSAIESNAENEFQRRYKDHPEDLGDWTVTITTAAVEGGSTSQVGYALDYHYEYYTVQMRKVLDEPGVK